MYEPETFAKLNRVTLEGTRRALKILGHRLRWSPAGQDTVLDIGCGPGNVLMNVFLESFRGKYSKCIATDLSDTMIEFARQTYPDSEKTVPSVIFEQMNVLQVDNFLQRHGHVDHVVSSFTVHWIQDQVSVFKNIFKLLKPGGDFFSVHCKSSSVFEVYPFIDQHPKWNQFFDNLGQFVPWSQKLDEPKKILQEMMHEAGFVDVSVELQQSDVVAESLTEFRPFLRSVLAQFNRLPVALQNDYVDEVLQLGIEKDLFKVLPTTGQVAYPTSMFVLYGRRTSHQEAEARAA